MMKKLPKIPTMMKSVYSPNYQRCTFQILTFRSYFYSSLHYYREKIGLVPSPLCSSCGGTLPLPPLYMNPLILTDKRHSLSSHRLLYGFSKQITMFFRRFFQILKEKLFILILSKNIHQLHHLKIIKNRQN